MTAAELIDMLRLRFEKRAWALFEEVTDATGVGVSRYADAMAMGLWPSNHFAVHGFEIKVSRADWLKELKDPGKSEAFRRYCDYWWLVVAEPGIVKTGELPSTWGLLIPKMARLTAVVKAPQNVTKLPMPVEMLAGVFRRAQEQVLSNEQLTAAFERGRRIGEEDGKRVAGYDLSLVQHHLKQLQKSVDSFERASGLKIEQWNGERLGESVKALVAMDAAKWLMRDVETMVGRVEALGVTLRGHLRKMGDENERKRGSDGGRDVGTAAEGVVAVDRGGCTAGEVGEPVAGASGAGDAAGGDRKEQRSVEEG